MASSRPVEPVMHCRKDRPYEVYKLSGRLLNGLYANPDKFPNPKVDKVLFETEHKELLNLISTSKGDSFKKVSRNTKAVVIHGYCLELLDFVKPLCKGDITLINLSGFDSNRQPRKHQPPHQPRIMKFVKTGRENEYKIILGKMKIAEGVDPDPATHQRDVRYTVELTLTPEIPDSWKEVCISMPSTKLIFNKVFPGERNYVRVYGTNSAGHGEMSVIRYFTPELP
jgi:hypothetical protein